MPIAVPPADSSARRRTTLRWATAATLVAGLVLGGAHGAAFADEDTVPTEADIASAENRAAAAGA